ncbi:MAG: PQQ-like beta-propeller repeat protein, partial [Acidobacteriota bacterium]|nr:PQQ-like beta-propeller repeat protein [Acidobacteriota bacterium]
MRKLRVVIVTLVGLLVVAAAALWIIAGWISRKQTEEGLARQAAELSAHRQAQRAETPLTPGVRPSATPTTAPAPDSPAVPAMTWAKHWTDFRGARRDGHYAAGPIRADWAGLQPLWRQPIGGGHASFVAADGRAFTIEQRGANEVAAAYDVLTGRELWTNAWSAAFIESMGGPGPRATPTFHDGTLFVLGATGEFRALDAPSGTLRWRTNILEDANAGNLNWGIAASPLVAGNTVITVPGGGNGRSIVAYDRRTGRVAWSALDDEAAYSSPVGATLAGVDQIVVFLATRVVAVSPDGGALLWEFPWTKGDNNAAQPVVIGDNRVFVSTASGGVLLEVTRGGDRLGAREAWRTNRMKNDFTTSVHHDGFIYGLDAGILACIDAASGELKWKAGRYGNGQVLLASRHLIITTDDGEVVLVRATPAGHEELARVSAVEGRTWSQPAIADGFLLVRNAAQMAAFDLR